MVLYDEFVSKFKTEKVALRHFEQYLIGIKRFKKDDFRIELLKRFIIWDHEMLSKEIIDAFVILINSWAQSLEKIFTHNLKSVFVSIFQMA